MYKSSRSGSTNPSTPVIQSIELPNEDTSNKAKERPLPKRSILKTNKLPFSVPKVELHRSVVLPDRTNSLIRPHAFFDVVLPPCYIRLWLTEIHPSPMTSSHRKKLISKDPFKTVIITCPFFAPGWKIVIERDGSVTCGDVFDSIYAFLRIPMTEKEIRSLSAKKREQCVVSLDTRCRTKPVNLSEVERRAGLLRADYLCGRTIFGGLALDPAALYGMSKLSELHCLMNLLPASIP